LVNFNYSLQKIDYTLSFCLNAIAFSYHQGKRPVSLIREFWDTLYNTKINKYLKLSVAMRNLWCLEKISILPLIISATGIVPQSLFKNLKILDLENTLVVEIQKGILFLNIDIDHKTQKSQNVEARRR
jgi:hypothetical protein